MFKQSNFAPAKLKHRAIKSVGLLFLLAVISNELTFAQALPSNLRTITIGMNTTGANTNAAQKTEALPRLLAIPTAQAQANPALVLKPNVEPVPAASVQAKPAPSWTVDVRDVTLANTFTRWAEAAGQRVRWDADKHILVDAPDTLRGTFEDAITAVLSSPGIAQGAFPLEVCFYPNNPPLARITRKGEQGKECK